MKHTIESKDLHMFKKIAVSLCLMGQMTHGTSNLNLEESRPAQTHYSLRKVDWAKASIEDMERLVAHKILKYKSIAENPEIDPSAREIYQEAYAYLNSQRYRFTIANFRTNFAKKSPELKLKYMEGLVPNRDGAKPFWKSYYQNIVSTATPVDPAVHRTLVVGCGHAQDLQKDAEGINGFSDHRHEGTYTINNDREGCAPDLASEIQNTAVLMKIFKNHQFDTIYLEYITTPTLSDDRTYVTAMHFLKPGGSLVFDAYYSNSYAQFSHLKNWENYSSIHLFHSSLWCNDRTFRLHMISPSDKMHASKTPDLASALSSIEGIEKYEPRATEWFDFKSVGEFYNRTIDRITLKEGLDMAETSRVLSSVSALLVKLYLEQAGFVNPTLEFKPNPWNGRLNSQLFSAQKPE